MTYFKRITVTVLILALLVLTGCQQIKDIFNPDASTEAPTDTSGQSETTTEGGKTPSSTQPDTQEDTQETTGPADSGIKEGSSLTYNEDSGDPANGSAVNITITLPQFTGEGSEPANDYMRERFDIIKSTALALRDSADPVMGGGLEYQYDYSLVLGGKYINVIQDEYSFMTGSVHPSSNRYADNFDAKTGQRVLLADFFKDNKGYVSDLAKRSFDIMYTDTKKYEYVGGYSREDIDANPSLKDEIISSCISAISNNTFVAGEEGLTLIYNPYAIAPYAMGIIEITIPWEKLPL